MQVLFCALYFLHTLRKGSTFAPQFENNQNQSKLMKRKRPQYMLIIINYLQILHSLAWIWPSVRCEIIRKRISSWLIPYWQKKRRKWYWLCNVVCSIISLPFGTQRERSYYRIGYCSVNALCKQNEKSSTYMVKFSSVCE